VFLMGLFSLQGEGVACKLPIIACVPLLEQLYRCSLMEKGLALY
jgi:hypothetical protein